MSLVIVSINTSYNNAFVMDSKKAQALIDMLDEALVVENKYDGKHFVKVDPAEVSMVNIGKRKIVSSAEYDAFREAELAAKEAE